MNQELGIKKFTRLSRSFYERATIEIARDLLGKYLIYEDKIGRICETEAYPGIGDRGSHSHKGLTKRTKPLFGVSGFSYVYLIYGMYHCFNVVTDTPESGGAVLIRAVEPVAGLTGKTTGPGLVCKAYNITRAHNELDLTTSEVGIYADPHENKPLGIVKSTRIGIDYAREDKELLYRFSLTD